MKRVFAVTCITVLAACGADGGPRMLHLDELVEARGVEASYTVETEAGHLVLASVFQRGIDVATTVFAPSGQVVDTFASPGGAFGPDPVLFRAAEGGSYRLEVGPAEPDSPGTAGAGHTIRLERNEPVAATPEERVQQVLDAWDDPDRPGTVAAVVEAGEVVYSRAMGLASIEHELPNEVGTRLDIGSVAKQFTAFAIVLLQQQGLLAVDDDIREHLPEVPDFGTPIRIRNLIHHTSGLREIYTSMAIAGWQAGDGIAQTDALQLVTRLEELNFSPGTQYLYCNTAYMLLADIVSRTTGRPFHEWMEENVFGPLGMEHTAIMHRPGLLMAGAAGSYAPDGDGWSVVFDNSGIQGAGGIYSTVGDLARWIGNMENPTLGGAEAFEQMQELGVLASGDTLDYAFGLRIDEHGGLRRIGHGGASAAFRASLAFYPDEGVGVITLSNHAFADPTMGDRVAEAWLGDRIGPIEDPTGPDAEAEEAGWSPGPTELEAYAGRFISPELETIYTFEIEEGRLTGFHRRHGAFELEPVAPDRFQGPSYLPVLRFQRSASGAVDELRVDAGRVLNLRFERMDVQ